MSARILLRKTSLVDFPGRVSSVFFFAGCNLRCPWCHNRELVSGGAEGLTGPEEALAHIQKRRSVLGGVVLSGGEPCLSAELPYIIEEIKKNGLPVKLDTNGMFPAMLEKIFGREETRPDYIALDLKTAPGRYAELLPGSGVSADSVFDPGEALRQSAALIRASGIAHEYRTIALPSPQNIALAPPDFISEKIIEALAPLTDNAPWYFRPFRGGNCLNPAWDRLEETTGDTADKIKTLAEKARALGKNAIEK